MRKNKGSIMPLQGTHKAALPGQAGLQHAQAAKVAASRVQTKPGKPMSPGLGVVKATGQQAFTPSKPPVAVPARNPLPMQIPKAMPPANTVPMRPTGKFQPYMKKKGK